MGNLVMEIGGEYKYSSGVIFDSRNFKVTYNFVPLLFTCELAITHQWNGTQNMHKVEIFLYPDNHTIFLYLNTSQTMLGTHFCFVFKKMCGSPNFYLFY